MNQLIDHVFTFNERVIGLTDVEKNALTERQHEWLQIFCAEEMTEFREAFEAQDIVTMVDAVCDLIYGAMGTFKKMGLTREEVEACFSAVHSANMTKRRGNKGRGSDEDATKPEDFVPPEEAIGLILFGGTGV